MDVILGSECRGRIRLPLGPSHHLRICPELPRKPCQIGVCACVRGDAFDSMVPGSWWNPIGARNSPHRHRHTQRMKEKEDKKVRKID